MENSAAMTDDKLGEVSDSEAHNGIHHGECLLNDDELLHCEGACNVTNVPAK